MVQTPYPIEDALLDYINTYADKKGKSPRIPLLIGHAGIGKSALVENAIESVSSPYGVRLVTIKGGFFDKSDLIGFVKVDEDKGLAEDAPNKDLLTATDAFVDACRHIVDRTEKKLAEENPKYQSTDDLTKYMSEEEARQYLTIRNYAKTPVLFFDEINRINTLVLKQLMVIINQKRLGMYKWENAPMVAAANLSVGVTDDALKDMYKYVEISSFEDTAIVDGFNKLEVDPSNPGVVNSFKTAMRRKYGSIPNNFINIFMDAVETFVKSFGDPEASPWYDVSQIKYGLDDKQLETPQEYNKFPTFRGWDWVFQYIKSKLPTTWNPDPQKPILVKLSTTMIEGLIGKEMTKVLSLGVSASDPGNFNGLIKSTGIELSFGQLNALGDAQQELLDESFGVGIPALIVGPTGIAKTAKVDQMVANAGAKIYYIDLCTQDKTRVRGYPTPTDLVTATIGIGGKFTQELDNEIRQIEGFPTKTTDFVPFSFKSEVQEALEKNQKLVVFYDHMNRADTITQSAVFDAISNNRISGVDVSELVKKNLIQFVAAGNVGPGYNVEELEAATVACFAYNRKDIVDDGDYNSFIQFARKHFEAPLVEMLIKSKDYILDAINADPGELTLASKLTSFRTFEALDTFIKHNDGFLMAFLPQKYGTEEEIYAACAHENYLGLKYGDMVDIAIDGDEMTLLDLLVELRAHLDGKDTTLDMSDPEILSTLKEADAVMYTRYWKFRIDANLDLKADGFRGMIRDMEKSILHSKRDI